jgi:hypothetical protein
MYVYITSIHLKKDISISMKSCTDCEPFLDIISAHALAMSS